MNQIPTYKPDPGSFPARVLALFLRDPDEYFTSRDLGLKFTLPSNGMKARLADPVRHGLLRYQHEAEDTVGAWYTGPNFKAWRDARHDPGAAGAAAAAPPQITPKAPPAKKAALNLASLVVHKNRPVPARRSGPVSSAYAVVWDGLDVNDCAELPDRAAHGLMAYVKKHKLPAAIRRLSPTTKGVWKLPAAGAGA